MEVQGSKHRSRGVTRETIIGLACFLAGMVGGMAAVSHGQGIKEAYAPAAAPQLRLEMAVGISKHKLAPEGTWWYEGFDTNAKLITPSVSAGVLWTPIKAGDWMIGARAGYANLGRVRASNSFPIFEDGTHRDARINPDCNRTTLDGCTGKFDGSGSTSGWYIGPAFERDFGGGVSLGFEAGMYRYRSAWTVGNLRAVDNNGNEFVPPEWDGFTWDSARSEHTTSYIGASARWQHLFYSARRYSMVHASRISDSADFIGMTSGPVWTVMVGLSWVLN